MMYFQMIMSATKVKVDIKTLKKNKYEITPEVYQAGFREFGMKDLCWSAFPNNLCTYQSPGGYFQNN